MIRSIFGLPASESGFIYSLKYSRTIQRLSFQPVTMHSGTLWDERLGTWTSVHPLVSVSLILILYLHKNQRDRRVAIGVYCIAIGV